MNIKKLFIIGLAAAGLLWAVPATAGPVGPPTITPAGSWGPSWLDTTYGAPFDKIEFFIMTPTYSFDHAASTDLVGLSGHLVNPTYSFIAGPLSTSDKTLSLFFSGNQPIGGVRVDIFEWNGNTLIPGQGWSWTNLPNGNWSVMNPPNPNDPIYNRTPVPEASAVLLLGIAIMAIVSVRKFWL